jgi:site-specific recombinase XerD
MKAVVSMQNGKTFVGRKKYAHNTFAVGVRILKSFLKHSGQFKNIKRSEIDLIELPESELIQVPEKYILDDEMFDKILAETKSLRDRAYLSLVFETGCRSQEAADLKWKHLKFEKLPDGREYVSVTIKSRKKQAKNKPKQRVAYVIQRTSYLRELLTERGFVKEDDFVFWNHWGWKGAPAKPITWRAAASAFRRSAERAGVPLPKGELLKLLRASSVTNKLRQGVPTTAIQKVTWSAGTDSKMLPHYERLCQNDVKMMIFAGAGVETVQTAKPRDTTIQCACGYRNAPGTAVCPVCKTALIKQAIDEEREASEAAAKLMSNEAFMALFKEFMLKNKPNNKGE